MQPSEFGQLFEDFARSAFRLETLPQYAVDAEASSYERFLNGQPLPDDENEDWTSIVASAVARGAIMQRVRLVPSPVTTYLRFEIEWGYYFNQRAGEEIRMLLRDQVSYGAAIESGDFWLFDDEILIDMAYTPEGSFIGAERVLDPDAIQNAKALRDTTLGASIPLSDYLARVRTQ